MRAKQKRRIKPDPVLLQLYRDTLRSYERVQALYWKCMRNPTPISIKRIEDLMKKAEENLRDAWRMMLDETTGECSPILDSVDASPCTRPARLCHIQIFRIFTFVTPAQAGVMRDGNHSK